MFWLKKTYSSARLQVSANVAELWEVEWSGMKVGEYHCTKRPQWEIFLTKSDADDFKLALEEAFKVLRQDGGTTVTVRKRAA